MKVLIFYCCAIGLVLGEWTPEQIAKVLDTTPVEKYLSYLEPELQREITKRQFNPTSGSPGEGAQHWCCKVDNGEPVPVLTNRTQIFYEKVSIAVKTGFHSCGTWGLGRCEQTTTRYHQEVKFGVKYMINPSFRDCPADHVICCAQYHRVNGNCIHNDHLVKHVDTFEFLHGIGLVKSDDHSSN